MTREEAKEILTHNWTRVDNPNYSESELDEAFFMAIEALSAQTDADLISRADAIKAIRKCKFDSDMPSYWYRGMENAQDIIENIPSTELPKGDLISRKVLMDRLESFCKWCKDGRLQGAEFVWDCIVPNVPSADAVEVVRCKDCKQRRVEGDCTHYYYCDIIGSICGDNEYCSFGERREP